MNQIAKNIVQDDIGKHVVFELNGNIVSVDLSASYIIEAMEKYHKLKSEEQHSHVSNVMSSRFDRAIETVKQMYMPYTNELKVISLLNDLKQSAIAYQKISET